MKVFEEIFKRKIVVASIGNCNVDMFYIVDKIPSLDEEALAINHFLFPGGAASNFAIAVSKLGHISKIIGLIGKDEYGAFLKNNFVKHGVDISCLKVIEGHTGRVIILVEEKTGNKVMVAYRGVNSKISDIVFSYRDLKNINNFHASSVLVSDIIDKFRIVKDKDIFVSYDPGSLVIRKEYNLFRELEGLVDILFVNKREYEYLKDKIMLTYLKDVMIVVKLGKKGSLVVLDDNIVTTKGFSVTVKDTTGAGDVFDASFIVCWHTLNDVEKCSIFSNAVAALKVMRLGAQSIPSKREILLFLKKNIGNI